MSLLNRVGWVGGKTVGERSCACFILSNSEIGILRPSGKHRSGGVWRSLLSNGQFPLSSTPSASTRCGRTL
jgi:hypothetical protein